MARAVTQQPQQACPELLWNNHVAVDSQGQSFSLSQVFLLGDSKDSCLFQKISYVLKKSKELPGPSKTHHTTVVADEAEVYDVYLLFVWQFSKVLIQVSKVELIFLIFFFNFLFPIFITVS